MAKSVQPSAFAALTSLAPLFPLWPLILTTCSLGLKPLALIEFVTRRNTMSVSPPAFHGTTILAVLHGTFAAPRASGENATAITASTALRHSELFI